MKPPLKTKSADDFQTPPEALVPLLPHLNKNWWIWECAAGKRKLFDELTKQGFQCIATDIAETEEWNFLEFDMPKDKYDCIITNPPYSLKQQFLERCYELKKPFALLLPLTALETYKRQYLYKTFGIEIILMPKRIFPLLTRLKNLKN